MLFHLARNTCQALWNMVFQSAGDSMLTNHGETGLTILPILCKHLLRSLCSNNPSGIVGFKHF